MNINTQQSTKDDLNFTIRSSYLSPEVIKANLDQVQSRSLDLREGINPDAAYPRSIAKQPNSLWRR